MSQARWFSVCLIDENRVGMSCENHESMFFENVTINGLPVKVNVFSKMGDAKFILDSENPLPIDAILYNSTAGDFKLNLKEMKKEYGKKIPVINMLANGADSFSAAIEEYYKFKNESYGFAGGDAVDVINNLFSEALCKINLCEDENVKIAVNRLVNKINLDFSDSAVGEKELSVIKSMLKRVIGLLDACHDKKNISSVDLTDPKNKAIYEQSEQKVLEKLTELKQFSATSYAKFRWGENIIPLVQIVAGAIVAALGAAVTILTSGLAAPVAVTGGALMVHGAFKMKKTASERSNAVDALVDAVKNPSLS